MGEVGGHCGMTNVGGGDEDWIGDVGIKMGIDSAAAGSFEYQEEYTVEGYMLYSDREMTEI